MHLFILSLLAVFHISSVAASCDACIYNICHRKIIVLERFEQIGQIAIDRTSNIFYFHVRNDKKKSFTCAYDLNNVQLNRIWDVDFSFARAVDDKTRDLYLSEESRVYKVNPKNDYDDGETVFNATVWHMQFKDKLYYSEFLTNGLKVYENGEHKVLEATTNYNIDDFIIDKHNDIYFSSDYSVYRLKNGTSEAKLFEDEIYSLTTDKFGDAYFIQPFSKGLFKIDYDKDKIVEIGAFNSGTPYKMVFSSHNYIIYSDIDFNGMYYLSPDTGSCKVTHEGIGKLSMRKITLDAM